MTEGTTPVYIDPVKTLIRRSLYIVALLTAYTILYYFLPTLAVILVNPIGIIAIVLTLILGFTRLSRDNVRMQEKVEYALMVIAKVAERVAEEERAKAGGGDGGLSVQ